MKNLSFAAIIFSAVVMSCSKKEPADFYPADSPKASYDTTAIDSFSNGAISVDVARQIRMSSKQYQDSVKEALKLQEQEKKLKEELEKKIKRKQKKKRKKQTRRKRKHLNLLQK
jgi:hypothetical protein